VTKVLAKHTPSRPASPISTTTTGTTRPRARSAAPTLQRPSTVITRATPSRTSYLGDPVTTGNATPNNYITRNISEPVCRVCQDDWKLRPNLTINAGLRYDLQWFKPNPYGADSLYIPSLKEVVVFGSKYPAAVDSQLHQRNRFRSRCRPT
jgi:hypothetical protein